MQFFPISLNTEKNQGIRKFWNIFQCPLCISRTRLFGEKLKLSGFDKTYLIPKKGILSFLKTDGLLKHSVLKQIYFLYKHTKKELEKWQGFGNKTTELPCTAFLFCHC